MTKEPDPFINPKEFMSHETANLEKMIRELEKRIVRLEQAESRLRMLHEPPTKEEVK